MAEKGSTRTHINIYAHRKIIGVDYLISYDKSHKKNFQRGQNLKNLGASAYSVIHDTTP
jgi:hypothetical protein